MLRALLEATETGNAPVLHELALGPFPARIIVDGLAVRSVSAGPFSGQDALFRLLLVKRRGVRSRPVPPGSAIVGEGVGSPRDLLENFDAHHQELERLAGRAGGFGRIWAVRFAALKGVLAGVPEDVKRVVRLLDGTRDLRTLLAESPLPAPLTVRVVERLLQQGALERADLESADLESAGRGVVEAREPSGPVTTADRSWLDERVTRPPQPAAPTTNTTTNTTTTNTAAATSTATTLAAALATTTAPASTALAAPTALVSTPPMTMATAANPTPAEPVLLERKRAPATTLSTLPTLPSPRPELQTWLGPEDEFFARVPHRAAGGAASWPPWTLAALVIAGAVVGALVARACVA